MGIKEILKKKFPYIYVLYSNYTMEKAIARNRKMYEDGKAEDVLAEWYKDRTGNDLNLHNPRRYTEKIQWRKLYGINPIFSELSDKYRVREWVKSKIGDEYLIPIFGAWENFSQIDFKKLPNEFVIKTNNASNTNIIVRDKGKLNLNLIRKKIDYWIKMDYAFLAGFEMQYHHIKPMIIIEQFIKDDSGQEDLKDYKFLCFNGKVHYIWVDQGRFHNHTRSIYNKSWKIQKWNQKFDNIVDNVPKPANLDEMIVLAEKLASDFDHVRVDLYDTGERIYFGEMTFTNGSGFENINPDEYDYILGNLWKLKVGENEKK